MVNYLLLILAALRIGYCWVVAAVSELVVASLRMYWYVWHELIRERSQSTNFVYPNKED